MVDPRSTTVNSLPRAFKRLPAEIMEIINLRPSRQQRRKADSYTHIWEASEMP